MKLTGRMVLALTVLGITPGSSGIGKAVEALSLSVEGVGRTGLASVNADVPVADFLRVGAGAGLVGASVYANAYFGEGFYFTLGVGKAYPLGKNLKAGPTEDSHTYFFPGLGFERLSRGGFLLRFCAYARVTWLEHTSLSPTPEATTWEVEPWGGVSAGYIF